MNLELFRALEERLKKSNNLVLVGKQIPKEQVFFKNQNITFYKGLNRLYFRNAVETGGFRQLKADKTEWPSEEVTKATHRVKILYKDLLRVEKINGNKKWLEIQFQEDRTSQRERIP